MKRHKKDVIRECNDILNYKTKNKYNKNDKRAKRGKKRERERERYLLLFVYNLARNIKMHVG